jgi:hypothetical protein
VTQLVSEAKDARSHPVVAIQHDYRWVPANGEGPHVSLAKGHLQHVCPSSLDRQPPAAERVAFVAPVQLSLNRDPERGTLLFGECFGIVRLSDHDERLDIEGVVEFFGEGL